jgi:adenylate kinase
MEVGDYVPDEITIAMLSERIGQDDAQAGYILDGFPRTVAQVESLDGLLGADGLSRVVVFEVDESELTERMLSRGRADDTAETIHNRFQVYADQTQPLIDVYDDRGLTMSVDGMGEMDEITDRIVARLSDLTR